ncbi:MAG: hypothetical protein Kow00121_53220 [Elainellaceae cyanobacterium]
MKDIVGLQQNGHRKLPARIVNQQGQRDPRQNDNSSRVVVPLPQKQKPIASTSPEGPPKWVQDQAVQPFDRPKTQATFETPPKWIQEQSAGYQRRSSTGKETNEEFFRGYAGFERDALYKIATALEDYQLGVFVPLIVGSVCLLYWFGEEPQSVYTVKFQPATTKDSPRYVDFTEQQFEANLSVENAYAVEMSHGKTVGLRPTSYPLTVSKEVAGISLGKATLPAQVVEFWVNGKKRGYFDLQQNKYISVDPEFDSLASFEIETIGSSGT